MKESSLKKIRQKEGKKVVKWSKEKIETRKKNWRMYRDHISNIEKNERLEIIQKLMINTPLRVLLRFYASGMLMPGSQHIEAARRSRVTILDICRKYFDT